MSTADKSVTFATESQATTFAEGVRNATIFAVPSREGKTVYVSRCSWRLIDGVLARMACGSYSRNL